MPEPLCARAGELDATEVIDALDDGRRVVIETEVFGSERRLTLRSHGSVYYCDTPTKLYRHESRAGMRECITAHGFVDTPDTEQ